MEVYTSDMAGLTSPPLRGILNLERTVLMGIQSEVAVVSLDSRDLERLVRAYDADSLELLKGLCAEGVPRDALEMHGQMDTLGQIIANTYKAKEFRVELIKLRGDADDI